MTELEKNITEIQIPVNNFYVDAFLRIPRNAGALVIFSHGSGSSRFSSRNNYVADVLHRCGIATLLADLLTPEEDLDYGNRFNITLLTNRLKQITDWASEQKRLKNLPVGYFGASTGAASALNAAADLHGFIKAVVSRGGRPDLAYPAALQSVSCPVLLIVGSLDTHVIQLNQQAFEQLNCKKEMTIIDGASHLFEEPGKLQEVAKLAAEWFEKNLTLSFLHRNTMQE